MRCEFCFSVSKPLYQVFLEQNSSMLYRCTNCGSCQADPIFPADLVKEYYQNSYFSRQQWQLTKAQLLASDYLEKISKYLITNKISSTHALEIGAGYGFCANELVNRYNLKLDVIEPSDDCKNFISCQFPKIEIIADTIDEIAYNKKYDHVFCFHLVEHLQRSSSFLNTISNNMNLGARLYILTPNAQSMGYKFLGQRWEWACPNQHYQFLSQQIPQEYFLKFGLRLLKMQDLHPATIHFPSVWRTKTLDNIDVLAGKIKSKNTSNIIYLKCIKFLYGKFAESLIQNRYSRGMASIEKAAATVLRFRPRDELLIVLEKIR